jgi:hypothetical protein
MPRRPKGEEIGFSCDKTSWTRVATFSAQGGPRLKFKKCPKPLELSFLNVIEKFYTLSVLATGNVRRNHFVEPGGRGLLRAIDGSHS